MYKTHPGRHSIIFTRYLTPCQQFRQCSIACYEVEILSSYHSTRPDIKPLPFPLLFENEKSFAYQLKRPEFRNEIISGCGPLLAQLATGESVTFNDVLENKKKEIKTGKYLYIAPGVVLLYCKREKCKPYFI